MKLHGAAWREVPGPACEAGAMKGDREVREVMRGKKGVRQQGRGGPATVHGRPSAWCMLMQDHVYVPHVQGELARGMGRRTNAGAGEASGIGAGAAISAQPVGSSMRQKPPKVARRSEEREPIFPVVQR